MGKEDPAQRAIDKMTPEQLEQAAREGNRLAQRVLRRMRREENRRGRKWSR